MAQYSKSTSGLNSYTSNKTINTTVDITNLNINGVNNITLLDYNDAVIKKGNQISSSLNKDEEYSVYGAPSKWIVDKEQQYNNCGVESCMNILSAAGLFDIKDQTKTENEFTLWAITNKFTDEYGEESTYADDTAPNGELNDDDGGTIYDQRKAILERYGLESGSVGNFYEENIDWFDDAFVNNPEVKGAYDLYDASIEAFNDLVDEYNNLIDAGKYDEAALLEKDLDDAHNQMWVYEEQYRSTVQSCWSEYFTDKYSDSDIINIMANAIRDGKAIIAGGDARYLWPNYEDYPEYVGHAITVLGVVYDSKGDVAGFYIQDTGHPQVGFSYISKETLLNLITSNGTDYFNGITQLNQTTFEIKSWADAMTATGNKSNNIITGNDAANVLNGMAGNDQLIGNGGNDTLDGGDGDDTLTGGAGEDVLKGGKGNDTYVFSKLNGNDIVELGASGADKLIFTDVEFAGLVFEKDDLDLVITYNTKEESAQAEEDSKTEFITIKDYFKGNNHALLVDVQDSSGETRDIKTLIAGALPIKFNVNDATLVHATFLDDNIEAPEDNMFDDTIYGAAGSDTIKTRGGNDLIYGDSSAEDAPFVAPFEGETYDDYIEAGLGDDTIYGEAGNNTIVFNAKNVVLEEVAPVAEGDPVTPPVEKIVGDGNDVVYSGQGTDALVFKDVKYEDLTFTFEGDNLVIKYGADKNNPDSKVVIVDYLKNGDTSQSSVKYVVDEDKNRVTIADQISGFVVKGKIDTKNELNGSSLCDTITGANLSDVIQAGMGSDIIDGKEGNDTIYGDAGDDYINGGVGNDEIYGGDGSDIIIGGAGKDKMYGDGGNNQFVFSLGDGDDTIYSGTGKDTLIFKDVAASDLTFINDNQGNLVIQYGPVGNISTVTIDGYFNKRGASSVTNIIDMNQDNYYVENLLSQIKTQIDEKYDNILVGTYLNDNILGSSKKDTIYGNLGNDTINSDAGDDILYGGDGDDVLLGGDGNDVLDGEAGHNEISGGTGDDTINGGLGENRILFKAGDGNDVVFVGKGSDTLVFEDVLFSDLQYAKDPYSNDLIIKYGADDSVRIKDYFNTKVRKSLYRIEALYKTGSDEMITREMNFIINDKDTVVLVESPESQVNKFTGSIYDDSIIGGNASQFTKNYYNGGNGNDTIVGGDREDSILGGNGNDLLKGGADRDTIWGGYGDDTIYGDGGSDLLYGEYGENTFHFTTVANPTDDLHLQNHDTIVSGKGTDILKFDDVESSQLEFFQNGNDLIIKYGADADLQANNSVTIQNYFKLKGKVSVKTIETTDSISNLSSLMTDKVLTVVAKQDVKNSLVGSYNQDSITGGNLADTLKGANANDTIDGGDGDDKLYGENGNDSILGGNGNDYIDGGKGNDYIDGGENDDKIYGNYGNDTIIGGKGDDRLYGVRDNNRFIFANGDGNDTVYSGRGSDTLEFTGADFANMKFIRSGNDLIIQYNGLGDTVTLANYAKSSSNSIKTLIAGSDTYNIQSDITVEFDGNKGSKNKISGTYMKDSITGGYYNDTIDGGNADDTIYGDRGNDYIKGGNGNDVIYGDLEIPTGIAGSYDDNDIIKGGNGNDSIYGGRGNDRIYGEAGTNNMYFNTTDYDGNDVVYSGKGYDILNFKDLNLSDLTFTRSGKNLVITYENADSKVNSVTISNYFANKKSSVKDLVTDDDTFKILTEEAINVDLIGSTSKKNKITGTFLNDSIIGGDYNDTLYAGDGNDTIDGGFGHDIIKGGNGNDVITGGAGNDRIYGEAGNNKIIFNVDDGQDTVYIGKGNDTLVFNGIAKADLRGIYKYSNNLVIEYGTNDKVTIANYFKTNSVINMSATFTDGNIDLKDLYNQAVTANSIDSASRTVKGSANNDVITASGSNQKIYGYQGNDSIQGGVSNESIYGGYGDDTIIAGAGNDRIYGEAGTNLIELKDGDGRDTIYSGKGEDILKIANDFADLVFARSGKNLVINYGDSGDYVTVANYFANTKSSIKQIIDANDTEHTILNDADIKVMLTGNTSKKNKITGTFLNDSLTGGDYNDTLSGGNGNDTIIGGLGHDIIKGGNGNDVITGGAGNDKIYGEAGENTLIFEKSNGNDIVYSGKGLDKLNFSESELAELEILNDSKNNLVINQDAGGSVTIANYFKLKGKTSFTTIVDKNGDEYTISEQNGQLVLTASDGTQNLITLYSVGSENKKNKLYGTYLNDSMKGGNYADSITGGNGEDTIKGGLHNDTIKSGNGNDLVYGDFTDVDAYQGGNDKIYGGSGNDTLYGGVGNDSIYGENDNDLIYGNQGNDYLDGGNGNDSIEGGAGNDILKGGNGNDTLYGGVGDDRLYGEAGENTMVFKDGDGQDIVYSGKGVDTLKFDDATGLTFKQEGNNLVISYNSNDYDKVIIANYFKSSSSVKYVQLKGGTQTLLTELLSADGNFILMNGVQNKKNSLSGTVYNDSITGGNLADTISSGDGHDSVDGGLSNDKLYGGNGRDTILGNDGNDYIDGGNDNDSLLGGAGNDTIRGGNGDDYIEGGVGNDRLYGDAGVNTFKFSAGDGNDVIYSGSGHDILDFSNFNFENDFRFVKNGNDLIIYYGESTGKVDSVTISSYFKGASSINTMIAKLDGNLTTVDIKDFANVEINGAPNSKNKIYGTALEDIILGGSQSDTISAGDGNDTVNGGAGSDSIFGGRDDDSLYGGAGHDTINGGTGDDIIEGGLDNDKLYGDAGKNNFVFNDGDGRDTIYSGSGTDTIVFNNITEDNLKFVYDKSSGSLIINYGSRDYDYVYLDSYIKNYGDTSVKYVKTKDSEIDLITLINNRKVNITAEAKKTTGGTVFNDIITSDNKGDVTINSSSGNDSLVGGDFNDTLNGGADNDTILGGAGNDYLYGDSGDDILYGGSGQFNYLYGDAGNDTLNGDVNSYYDYLYGGSGDDVINAVSDYFTEAYGGDGSDTYNIGLGATKISDSSGNDVVNIDAAKNNIGVFFNVDINQENIFRETNTSDLYLYDKTKMSDILEELQDSETLPTDKLVQIETYFGKGEIEEIKTSDDYSFTSAQMNELKENVAAWLGTTGYMSTEEILQSKDEALIIDMLTRYSVNWQSPTP